MTIPNKPGYTHGSTGTEPDAPIDYASGDPVDESEFDYYIYNEFEYINALIDALNALDSNDDGKVDAADTADEATNVTSTYKGNDIDSDGDGVVNRADQVAGSDGSYHDIGSLPTFSDNTTAINNTSAGDIWFNTSNNTPFFNKNGTAEYLTAKTLDILVNGVVEDSFTQRQPDADYDISASTSNTTTLATIADGSLTCPTPDNADGTATTDFTIPSTAPSSANAEISANAFDSVNGCALYINGSQVASGSPGFDWTGTVAPGDSIEISTDIDVSSFAAGMDYTVEVEIVSGADIVVNSVTQS